MTERMAPNAASEWYVKNDLTV
jgi:Kinesin motor domain